MIKLKEMINHILNTDNEDGLTPVDNWKMTDSMYLEDMGFKNDGMYYYALKKPEIRVGHKKGVGFVVEDKGNNKNYTFPKFKELEEFFANYQQKWENAPYNE
jgi:hypothetical protein